MLVCSYKAVKKVVVLCLCVSIGHVDDRITDEIANYYTTTVQNRNPCLLDFVDRPGQGTKWLNSKIFLCSFFGKQVIWLESYEEKK